MEPITEIVELGVSIGREQAFGLIARGCTTVQAEYIRQMKESEAYRKLGLTWDKYCPTYLGISRVTADEIVNRLKTLGEGYFRLREFLRISPGLYRRIQPAVRGESIEIDGQMVPITAENSARIRAAILKMRTEITATRELAGFQASEYVIATQNRMAHFLGNLSALARRNYATPDEIDMVAAIARRSIEKLTSIIEDCGRPR